MSEGTGEVVSSMQDRLQEKRDQEHYAEARLDSLREMLEEHGVDAVLVSNPTNIFYLTSFKGVQPQEQEVHALVRPDAGTACGDPVAVT
jgi:Xaa-Pro aminopeptidase